MDGYLLLANAQYVSFNIDMCSLKSGCCEWFDLESIKRFMREASLTFGACSQGRLGLPCEFDANLW